MEEKIKKIVIKIPNSILISIFIILSIIIIMNGSVDFLSNFDKFQSEHIVNIIAIIKDFNIVYNHKFIFYLVYVLVIVVCLFKKYIKNDSIKIMIVNTFENTKININTRYAYENKDFYIDLSENIKIIGKNYLNYLGIVKKIDTCVEEFMQKKDEKYYAFAGILHTPFILRLGYKVGDQTYFKLFHKKRYEDKFKLLSDKDEYIGNYPKLNIEKQLKESNILIVSIATTFPITRQQLKEFNIEDNNYLKFETEKLGFDIVLSEKQVNDYKKEIFDNIRKLCREKEIKLIHLCISSSVAFTFALGQGFSEKYDPKVIIYNYENQNYSWGLNLFESSENNIICLKEKENIKK